MFRSRNRLVSLVALLLTTTQLSAAPKLPKAEQVLADARNRATEQHKTVFLIFGASWCPTCHDLDTFLDAPEIHPILDKYFVIAKVSVLEEAGGKPELNNPGSEQLLGKFGGIGPGGAVSLPFLVVVDAKGIPLVNSKRPVPGKREGADIDFPPSPDDLQWYMSMLKKGAPEMTEEESQTVSRWLRNAASSE
jgi:thiol-disulfide isomerase/thioredoxin